jgi:addiction module RelE/StbE family toxin
VDAVKVVWLPAALHALDREYDYLAARNPSAARSVFSRIVAITRRLGDFPQSGRPGQISGTRELVIPDLPYVVIYRVTALQVEILRVFHTARDWPNLIS